MSELLIALAELGPWSFDDDVRMIDTDGISALVERIDTGDGTAIVLLTVRGVPTPTPEELILRDATGRERRGTLTKRGQLRFDDVAPAGFVLASAPAADNVIPLRPFVRIDRVLANAAASGRRVIAGTFVGPDPTLETKVEENEEGRLIAVLTSTAKWTANGLAQLRWTAITSDGVATVRTLITPLAPAPAGASSARYDLGSVLGAEAIEVQPAVPIPMTDLTVEAVRESFSVVLFGSAVRAWEGLSPLVSDPAVRAAITEELNQ